ncbi:hypothetical protein [Streptomyces fumanus]|uniref:hypothetical protein n=1 Tax=Streptomyces fumanus TaxID=67302 RepID=UPI0033E04E94
MITFVDLEPMAHIRLELKVPQPLPAGGWTWAQPDAYPDELARDYAYSDAEARSLVHTYGRIIPVVLSHKAIGDRFRVCAWGVTTGLCVGIREWGWFAEVKEYRPVGEYLSGWKEAIRAYYRLTGEVFEEKRFHARCGFPLKTDADSQRLNAIPAQPRGNVLAFPVGRHSEDTYGRLRA